MFSPRKSFLISTPVSVSVDLCRTVALLYFLIASFSVMINLRCLSNFLSRFWKYLHAKIAFGFLTLFRWLCNLKLDAFSIFPIYCFVAQREAKGLIAFLQTWTKLVETKLENPVNSRNDSIFQIPISPLYPQISMLNLAKFRFQKIVAFIIFNFITANNSCSVGWSLNISLKLTLICSIFQY